LSITKFKHFAYTICFFVTNFTILCQTHYLHPTTKEGLPSNKVYCAEQDAAGFIWFGTDNGLVRYNGLEFKTFTVRDGLPDNDVFSVFEELLKMFGNEPVNLWLTKMPPNRKTVLKDGLPVKVERLICPRPINLL
jgi:hypothetical protein